MTDEKRMSEILQRHRAELMALDKSTLVAPRVSRARVVALSQTLVDGYQTIAPMLDDELSKARATERRGQAEGLEERALAFFAADLAQQESASSEPGRRAELAQHVAECDHYLFKWAWPMFGDDPELATALLDIQRGRGQQDCAEDVLRLVEMFRDHWAQASGQTPVTLEYLDRAEADATRLVTMLDADDLDGVRDLARRAYSAWYHDYRDIMALGRYLLRDRRGIETMFPGIAAERRSARRGPSSSNQPDEPASAGGEPVAPTEPPRPQQ
ncbi:MAG: hypothetical protein MJE77_44110 [Proteobacteria bacterium]|nr:hypothetical protein [Pseudomonadota bacterium]